MAGRGVSSSRRTSRLPGSRAAKARPRSAARATSSAPRCPVSGPLARDDSGAGSFFRYYTARDQRLNDVKLGADQEVDGLPCLGGTKVWFHPNQRVRSLHLASDHDVDGIPCASGENLLLALNFHRNGRLAAAVLARDHVLVGREFPRGTHVSLDEKGGVAGVTLREDRDIDGIPVKPGAPELKFHDNGRLGELILARDHVVSGPAIRKRDAPAL